MKSSDRVYKRILLAFGARSVATFCFALTSTLALQKFGLSNRVIAAAFSLMPLATILLDLPMGVLADRFSYRSAVLAAGGCDLASVLFFLAAPWTPGLAFAGFALKGTANALESGAFRLMILDAAQAHFGDATTARKRSSHDILFVLRFSSVFGVGLGLFLLRYSAAYSFYLSAAGSVLCLALVATTSFERLRERRFQSIAAGAQHLKQGLLFAGSAAVLPILVYVIIEGFRNGTDAPSFAPYARLAFGGENWLWTLAILSFVIRTPSNWLAHRLDLSPARISVFAPLAFTLVGVLFLVMGTHPSPVPALSCIALNFMIYSFRDYWFDNWQLHQLDLNPHLPRATTLSALSVVQNTVAFFGAQTLAFLGLLGTPERSYLLCGSVVVVGGLVTAVLGRRAVAVAR